MLLNRRICRLEQVVNTAPMLTMQVDTKPTSEQEVEIARCIRSGRRLIVFYMPDDTAWLAGNSEPPWGTLQ